MPQLHRLTVAVLIAFLCVGAECVPDPPGLGAMRLFVERQPFPGLESITFRAERLEVLHSETVDGPVRRITVASEERDVSLTGLADQLPTLIGAFDVPAGFVHQIRLVTEGGTLLLDGESLIVRVPSGPESGVKVVPEDEEPFPIETGEVTSVALLLDPEQQLVFLGGPAEPRGRDVNPSP